MELYEYTPDAICRAMSIAEFADRDVLSADPAALRLLLKPSFSPELCITVVDSALVVTTLREMLWHRPHPCVLPSVAQRVAVDEEFLSRLGSLFAAARHEIEHGSGPVLLLDGMHMDAVWPDGAELRELSVGVADEAVEVFLAFILQRAFHELTHPLVLRNLQECALHANLELPTNSS